jgi:2'-5' RNA ligase
MRAFIAVNLPREERAQLHAALAPLREQVPLVRWLNPDALHITLKFLGDIEGSDLDRIRVTIDETVANHAPLTVALAGLGGFPSLRRANIVWIGVTADPRLDRLQRDIELALSRLGFAREKRPFRGHITVGRAQSEARLPSLERSTGVVEYTGSIVVESVELMRSHTDAGGARYETLSRHTLGEREIE